MQECHDVVIVGAGHGGTQLAISLRQRKFRGTIGIVSAEAELPYERPPLSKDYLSGERPIERMRLRPDGYWSDANISLRLQSPVVAVRPAETMLILENGEAVQYRTLVWAAGGTPRSLNCPGAGLTGVYTLRTLDDADALRRELPSVQRVVVVGGGYIGLESAATLRKLCKEVTVIEAADRVLARVSGESLSRFYEAAHRAHGVGVRLSSTIEGLEEKAGRVCAVRLKGGQSLAVDMVIVGIGITPNCEPLFAAGAACDNGVLVDDYGRTSLPGIYALGDCARHPNVYSPRSPIRLESVQNASDMAGTVAKAITGDPEPYRSVPWFWSKQYDLRLQTAGISCPHDIAVIRGEPADAQFSVVYCRGGRVVALDCVNSPKDFIQGRALIQNSIAADPIALANTKIPLKEFTAH